MLRVRFPVFCEKLDVVFLQTVVVAERSKELPACELIGKLIAAVSRSHLLENRIAPQGNIEPAHAGEHRSGKKVLFTLPPLQLRGWNPDALAEAQEQRPVTRHLPGCPFEILIAHLRLDDLNELLVDFRIVNAGELTPDQLGRVDRHVVGKDSPGLAGPNTNFVEGQFAVVQGEIKRMMQTGMAVLHFVDEKVAEFFSRQNFPAQHGFSRHESPHSWPKNSSYAVILSCDLIDFPSPRPEPTKFPLNPPFLKHLLKGEHWSAFRHSRASGNPGRGQGDWMPASALG